MEVGPTGPFRSRGLADMAYQPMPASGRTRTSQKGNSGLSPQALGDWQEAEIAKWWPMIKSANVKVD
jgi:hypothetical protein